MKYIHYCWFGDKTLSKLAKKCIKSWKKYLPDYKIIKWSEDNIDLNECPFLKGAYENKKWAFVSDYIRTKALNEMGGIYFDTDMEITKDISKLLNDDTFLGVEDSSYVAVGVWYEKYKKSFLTTELLKIYKSFNSFDVDKMADFSIPKLISLILDKIGFKKGLNEKQILKNNIAIYPRDYFYPYSYNWQNNKFTSNTCMVHYYDASWIPIKDRVEINMVRKFGIKKTYNLLNMYRKIKSFIKQIIKVILFPIIIYKNIKNKLKLINEEYKLRVEQTINLIYENKDKDYIVFYNKEWLGVTSATKELFDNLVDCGELYRKQDIKKIAKIISKFKFKQVIFSSFAKGWKDLVIYIKKYDKKIKIKTYWHGSHSQVLDSYGWQRNMEIINLHKNKKVDVMATCKESLLNFYKNEGYNVEFLTNKVDLDISKNINAKKDEIVIGVYAAKCDDWRKNMFSQLAAISLIENAVVDMVPLNNTAIEFCKHLGLKLKGTKTPLSRDKLLERMSKNDLNLYITFSECAPMLPLESMEMEVICLTGNNHHYFKNTKLEKYLVVNNEPDVSEIKCKIKYALNNREKILKEYKKFSINNKKNSKKQIKKFLSK